jgi:transcriptional regulator with XRE-family HTH domain
MNETQKLIEEVRKKLGGATDYKIAQVLDLPKQRLSDFTRGLRSADSYACAKMAEALERDPLELIARVEAESATTEKKREFWKTFRSSGNRAILEFLLCATLLFSGVAHQAGGEVKAFFRRWKTSHNGGLRYIGTDNLWNRVRKGGNRRAVERGEDRRYLTIN